MCLVQGKEQAARRNAERQEHMLTLYFILSPLKTKVLCSKKEGERKLEKSEGCLE